MALEAREAIPVLWCLPAGATPPTTDGLAGERRSVHVQALPSAALCGRAGHGHETNTLLRRMGVVHSESENGSASLLFAAIFRWS